MALPSGRILHRTGVGVVACELTNGRSAWPCPALAVGVVGLNSLDWHQGHARSACGNSRRTDCRWKGPLLGVNRTKSPRTRIDEIDPTETWAAQVFRSAKALFVLR